MRALIGEDIELLTILGGGRGRAGWPVNATPGKWADGDHMIVNARDAMPRRSATLQTSNVLCPEYALKHVHAEEGVCEGLDKKTPVRE